MYTMEIRTEYHIYDRHDNELWTGSSLGGYDIPTICENLKDDFVYGCWVATESMEWVKDNLSGDYYCIKSFEIFDGDQMENNSLILIKEEIDAMAFRLRWID